MSSKTDILDTATAAKLKGVSQRRIQQFINDGRLPAIKLGKTYGVKRGDLDKIKEMTRGPKPKGKRK